MRRPIPFLLLALYFIWMTVAARGFHLVDIGTWDEALYLTRGAFLEEFRGDWGSAYSLYYVPFHKIFLDPIDVFDSARYVLLFFLLPCGLFLFIRKLTGNSILALVTAAFIPTLPMIVRMDPGIQLFNLMVWLFILAALFKVSRYPIVGLLVSALFGILPFIRQDNSLYIAVASIALVVLYQQKYNRKEQPISLASVIALSGMIGFASFELCCRFLGDTPFTEGRALHAFCDHYYWNHLQMFPRNESIERADYVLKHFGSPSNMTELILNNLPELIPYFQDRFVEFFERFGSTGRAYLYVAVPFLGVFGVRKLDAAKKILLAILVITFAKSLMVSVVMRPKGNYYVEFYVFIFIAALWAASTIFRTGKILSGLALVFVVLAMSWNMQDAKADLKYQFRQHIYDLRKLLGNEGIDSAHNIFGTGPVATFFALNADNRQIYHYRAARKQFPFPEYLKSLKIDAVLDASDFRNNVEEAGFIPAFVDFETNYAKYGFRLVQSKFRRDRIYIRNEPLRALN